MDPTRAHARPIWRRSGLKPRRAGLLLGLFLGVFLAASAMLPRCGQAQAALSATAEKYLRAQLASVPGVPTIAMDPPQVQNLAACAELFPFMPEPIHIRARMSVGVRCASPQTWTTFVQATVSIAGQYYVASRRLGMGQVLQASDLSPRKADLATLPPGVILDPSQAIGMKLASTMMPGQMLRTDNLRSAHSIQRGQTVQLVVNGRGFRVSSEGRAMNSAGPGENIQVRISNGQIISGVVGRSGEVDVPL